MRTRLSLALLLFAVPAFAFEGLFEGIDPAWAQAQEAMRQHKLEEARRKRAEGPRLKPLGDLVKPHRVPKQDPSCVFEAVGARLGASTTGKQRPEVWYASRTLLHDFAAWQISEYGPSIPYPNTISTAYLPSNNVIFMDDEGVGYAAARTIDDALAGQFTLYFEHKRGNPPDSAAAGKSKEAVERWFNSEYSAKGVSACKG